MAVAMILMQMQEKFAQHERLSDALTELVDWFNNPKHLVITLDPEEPVQMSKFAQRDIDPQTAADTFGLTIQANDAAQ